MHVDTIKVFYLPTDAQESCLKKLLNINNKIYIKLNYIKFEYSFKATLLCISW